MTVVLSSREREYLERIRSICRRTRIATSGSDVASSLGVTRSAANLVISGLVTKGMVTTGERNSKRTLVPVGMRFGHVGGFPAVFWG